MTNSRLLPEVGNSLPEPNEAATRLILRKKAKSSLVEFSKYTMPEYQAGWFHKLISDKINEMIHGDLRRLIISLPPRHGKSELISRRLPAYLLGIQPDLSIMAASYSSDLASRNNRDIQRIIDGGSYKELFPATTLNEANSRTVAGNWLRNSDLFEIVGRKGVYRCAGVGGGITGMGGHWLIIDDPVKNREEADSSVYREKIWNWYTSTFTTRQEADARILIVMTRWHSEDLIGKLQELQNAEPLADKWETIHLPAIAELKRMEYDPRLEGEALWPWKYNYEKLLQMKASVGDYQWAALYQQSPRAGGGTEWPETYFGKGIWFDEWPKILTIKTIGIDPSKGRDGRSGDYSAVVRLGRDNDGVLFVEADLDRINTEVLTDRVIEIQKEFAADAVAIESNQFQELLAVQIEQKAKANDCFFPTVKIVNTISKQIRIRRLGPYLAQGLIRFKSNSNSTRLLVDQLKDFPTASHDDGPDALEMALRVMIDLHNGRTLKTKRGLRA